MATVAQIAAARRFAPPLITTGQIDRRGAKLRYVNRRAIDYARRAGLTLTDVYPDGLAAIRALAPAPGTDAEVLFARDLGLPPSAFGAELAIPVRRWCWGWALAGALLGAMVVGPVGALAGGVFGGVR